MTDATITIDEEGIKKFQKTINSLYKTIGSPLSDERSMYSDVIKNFTDKSELTHFSKMLRASMASQRLFTVLDDIKEIVFTHQYLNEDFEINVEDAKVNRKFLEIYLGRNLALQSSRAVLGLINFLAYYFDLPDKDGDIKLIDFRNFLYFNDNKICSAFEQLVLNGDAFQKIEKLSNQTQKGYLGLSCQTKEDISLKASKLKMTARTGLPLKEMQELSEELLSGVFKFIELLNQHIRDNYSQGLGFDSSNDFVTKVDTKTGAYKGVKFKKIEEAKKNLPIKLFNMTRDTPMQIETDMFTMHKNHTFRDLESFLYRSSEKKKTSIAYGSGKPAKTIILPPQEGLSLWTHTVFMKDKGRDLKSRFTVNGSLMNDVEVILTLLTGNGVYTESSALMYSHKTKVINRLHFFEIQSSVNDALNCWKDLSDEEIRVVGLMLLKYREAMQPMSDNLRLVRLWEILDIYADHYCEEPMKPVPSGYRSGDDLKNVLKEKMGILQADLSINLIGEGGFTPIMLNRSAGQKLNETLKERKIPELLNVKFEDLKKRVGETYSFRSKFSHSSKPFSGKRTKDLEFVEYYFFLSDLVFVVLLDCLAVHPDESLKSINKDIGGFVKNRNYFKEKSAEIEKRAKKFEEASKYLSGEKPWPKGLKSISF